MKRDWDIMRKMMLQIESGYLDGNTDRLFLACREKSDPCIQIAIRDGSLSYEDIIKCHENYGVEHKDFTIDEDEYEHDGDYIEKYPNYQTEVDRFTHHVDLLVELGYIVYWRYNNDGEMDFSMLPMGRLNHEDEGDDYSRHVEEVHATLTNKGHDFLDLYRDDNNWEAFKQKMASLGFKDGFPSYMVMPEFHR